MIFLFSRYVFVFGSLSAFYWLIEEYGKWAKSTGQAWAWEKYVKLSIGLCILIAFAGLMLVWNLAITEWTF
jgi:hypothetical protein